MLYHLLRAAATVALRWYYADIVVQGKERVPRDGPLLLISNHPNAMVDALLAATIMRRRVRLTAKATLFEHPFLSLVMRAVGVVPLRRAADERRHTTDGVPVSRNADAFRLVTDALAGGGAVLVFPEGISHDAPALMPLKTGSARMALEAAASGVRGVRVLTLGLVFEAKETPRSRVLVRVGDPLDVDHWRAINGPAVGALTSELGTRLRDVTLNFASDARAATAVSTARALAAITRTPPPLGMPPALIFEMDLARRIDAATAALADAPPAVAAAADAFVRRLEELEARLAARGANLADLRISPGLRAGAWFVVREGALGIIALPVAAVGRATHWLPIRLARALALRSLADDPSRDQPAMRTIVLGVALTLLWYAAQGVAVMQWWGGLAAVLWIVGTLLAAWVDFILGDRLARAHARARTYRALRADPLFAARAVADADTLLGEAQHLEELLISPPRP